jgi:peptidoglycan/xylan/chitin deacetylase (PgdA/CDA1 family)
MSSDQLRALARAGHEIGSHTSTHPILTRLDDATLASELVSSRARLADAIGAPVTSIAYPNGDHDDRVVAAARRAGYTLGCTTSPGHVRTGHDPLRLPRIEPNVHRVTRRGGQLDLLALRSEIALTREVLR